MTITSSEDLGKQIERVVSEYLAAGRKMAELAMQRAFGMSTNEAATVRPDRPRKNCRRRPQKEIEVLAERLYTAMCATPGETMAVLAIALGASASALHLSMSKLKSAGRVRSAGQRNLTRYFPMVSAATQTP
ncbi:MAG TPA: winged helix-turn-helix domain-containing protein [Polyangia bacterium]|jgi:hypothetical protein|nr:winged helix-turn-helix domain-containing protein [Polyangia bacterium]